MTATTRTLADIMAAEHITITLSEPERTRDEQGWDHHAFRFTLDIAGEQLMSNAPYSAGLGIDVQGITDADVFGAVVMDCQSIAPYLDSREQMDYDVDAQTRQSVAPGFPPSGWEEWADDLGMIQDGATPASVVQSMRAFQEMAAHAALLREMLGADVFDELMALEL